MYILTNCKLLQKKTFLPDKTNFKSDVSSAAEKTQELLYRTSSAADRSSNKCFAAQQEWLPARHTNDNEYRVLSTLIPCENISCIYGYETSVGLTVLCTEMVCQPN